MARNKQFKGIATIYDRVQGHKSYLASPYRSFIELYPRAQLFLFVMWRVVAIVNAIT